MIFDPYPSSSAVFLLQSVGKFGQFLTPLPLRNANVLNFIPFIGKQASATPSQKSTVSQPPQPPKTPPQPSITATPATPTTPTIATKAGQEQITAYLESNPEFLENYVISNVDFQTVERWVIRKARDVQKGTGGKIY